MRNLESEADFSTWVEDLLARFGFTVAHFHAGMTSRTYTNKKGETRSVWVTPVSCDGKGFYDYVAVKVPRFLLIELKSEDGTVTPEQQHWLDMGAQIEVVETYLWRPSDRPEIEQIILLGHVPNLIERAEFKSSWRR